MILLFNGNSLITDMSILVVIERISRYQLKTNYLKNQKRFAVLLLHFWNLQFNFEHFEKKNEPLSLTNPKNY